MHNDTEKTYGLLGRTLGHSYSPIIHRALGNDTYRLIELEPEEIGPFLDRTEIGGLNVTIPYKLEVLPYCDARSASVEEIGAANTIVMEDGKRVAHNTDKAGFMEMTRSAGIPVEGMKVLILGNGGASLAVKAGLKEMGAREILALETQGDYEEELKKNMDADVVVNCTPVGMFPHVLQSLVDLKDFPNCKGVLDVVYNPARTALLLQAEELGLPHAGGLRMLVAQGVKSHDLWFRETTDAAKIGEITHSLQMDAQNIILCGMPGSGKSSVARILGELSGKPVIDLDEEITKAAGKPIPQIFADDGETAFRDLESEQIAKFGAKSGQILSLGGGAVLREQNYLPLHQNGRIYWIRRDLSLLAMNGRPLSKDRDTLKAMEKERKPRYERFADAIIENDGTIRQAAEQIWTEFGSADLN
ncbi:MAG: shikimate kinase [Clostridia bacterium]|nr:shikimate kinase [Clostridia bacterium]